MLPIGTALVQSRLAGRSGQAFTATLAPAGPLALITGLYLFTVALTQTIVCFLTLLLVMPLFWAL